MNQRDTIPRELPEESPEKNNRRAELSQQKEQKAHGELGQPAPRSTSRRKRNEAGAPRPDDNPGIRAGNVRRKRGGNPPHNGKTQPVGTGHNPCPRTNSDSSPRAEDTPHNSTETHARFDGEAPVALGIVVMTGYAGVLAGAVRAFAIERRKRR